MTVLLAKSEKEPQGCRESKRKGLLKNFKNLEVERMVAATNERPNCMLEVNNQILILNYYVYLESGEIWF